MRSNARLRVRTRPTGAISVPKVRIGLIAAPCRSSPERRRCVRRGAGTRACRGRTRCRAARAPADRRRPPRRASAPPLGRARRRDHEAAEPAGAGLRRRPPRRAGMPALGMSRAASARSRRCPTSPRRCGPRRCRARPRRAARRPRGSRRPRAARSRQRRRLLQPHVERVEVVVGVLGPQVAVPAHIQADLPDAPPIDRWGGRYGVLSVTTATLT